MANRADGRLKTVGEVDADFDSDSLHRSLAGVRYRDLSANLGDGVHDERWHVIVNADIEHDL